MPRKFSLHRLISQALRLPLAGPVFKLYAPRLKITAESPERRPLRVLVANLMPSLGDTICYMPVAEVLAELIPDIEITWVADSAMAPLMADHPNVDRVIEITTPHPTLRRIPTVKMYYRLYRILNVLFSSKLTGRFDVAIIPRGGIDPALSAQAVWVLNVARSVGYSHLVEPEDTDHNFGDQLITDLVTRITTLHESSRALYLLERAGLVPDALQRWNVDMPIRGVVAIAAKQNKPDLLRKAAVAAETRFIAVAPGAGALRKTWPAQKFKDLCARILSETDFHIVLTGTPTEAELCSQVGQGFGNRVINAAGKLNLKELIGLLSLAAAFVGNDSGAGHIAGPLGIPVVSIHVQPKNSDPNHIHAPEHYRPAGPHVTIIQPHNFIDPCHSRCESPVAHCIDQIAVETVWSALGNALKLRP